MTTFTRRVTFNGVTFFPAMKLTESGIRKELEAEVPNLPVYDVEITTCSNREDPFLDPEPVLRITQHIIDEFGERNNFVHELHKDEWLIEDVFSEHGWRVVHKAELRKIIA